MNSPQTISIPPIVMAMLEWVIYCLSIQSVDSRLRKCLMYFNRRWDILMVFIFFTNNVLDLAEQEWICYPSSMIHSPEEIASYWSLWSNSALTFAPGNLAEVGSIRSDSHVLDDLMYGFAPLSNYEGDLLQGWTCDGKDCHCVIVIILIPSHCEIFAFSYQRSLVGISHSQWARMSLQPNVKLRIPCTSDDHRLGWNPSLCKHRYRDTDITIQYRSWKKTTKYSLENLVTVLYLRLSI